MPLKSQVLEKLEQNRARNLSGEALAKSLGVSRNAIWKAIGALKDEGYIIHAATRGGYRLSAETDLLSAEGLRLFLREDYKDLPVTVLKSVDSTNNYAKRLMGEGAVHGSLVLSEEQTAGRGRYGRGFYSPAGASLYMSVILRPKLRAADATLLTAAAALAVCRTVGRLTGEEARIKWVNDIFLGERKLCGILSEAMGDFESGMVSGVVVGIGLNCRITQEEFRRGGLGDIAVSLFAEGSSSVTRNQLAAEITAELLDIAGTLPSRDCIREYKDLSCILGKEVIVREGGEAYTARALDIDENGALIVTDETGKQKTLFSGEVSIQYGNR